MTSLYISWFAYRLFLYSWIVLAVIIFFLLLRITAPYGRHASKKWGPSIDNRYGWIIMEATVLFVLYFIIYPHWHSLSLASWIMVSLFCFHYFNRAFIFPFRLHTSDKKMPLIVMVSGIFFNIANGFSFGYYFAYFADYTKTWLFSFPFISGVIIFFAGVFINWKADDMLIRIRKPNETHYLNS